MKTMLKLIAALLPIVAQADWNKPGTGGSVAYDYNDPANWTDGIPNGVFGSELATGGTVYLDFTGDYTGSLTINPGKAYNYHFRSKSYNGSRNTMYLTEDPVLMPIGRGSINFGYYNNNNGSRDDYYHLVLDLGNQTRTFQNFNNTIGFVSIVTNGNVRLKGTGTFNLQKEGRVFGDIEVGSRSSLYTYFYSNDSTPLTVTRAERLILGDSMFFVNHNNRNREQSITGALVVDGLCGNAGIVTFQNPTETSYNVFQASELCLTNGGVLVVRSAGATALGGVACGVNHANFLLKNEPELKGGLVQGVRMGVSNGGDARDLNQTFATYVAGEGLVPVTDFVGVSDVVGGKNVAIQNGETLTLDADTSINSLVIRANGTATKVVGSGVVRVTSGQIAFCGGSLGEIDTKLDFGDIQGCVTAPEERKYSRLKGAISGTKGLVLATPVIVGAKDGIPWQGNLILEGDADKSTYVGDTYVTGAVAVNSVGIFPCGDRKGDVYVGGLLMCGADITINGLHGRGNLGGKGRTISVGDNDADGDFSGGVNYNSNPLAKLLKIGKGVQRLGGVLTLTGAIEVKEGAVVLDGSVERGAVNVAAGAALGGSGVVKTSVDFAEGAKLLAKVEGKTLAAPLTVAAVSGTAIVEADGSWKGEACVLKAADGATLKDATFVKGENVASLRLSDDKTELYASPKTKGLAIVIL